jgi:phage terminase large subunit
MTIAHNFPEKLEFLFRPKRYKVAYGGRGGAKSWGFARALLLQMIQKPLRVLCAREFQNSISESVHETLRSQIEAMGLGSMFQVLQTEIRCVNGGEFQFVGIRNNPQKVKSYEDFDICWVEEANKVTEHSWMILTPTIRKPGSEIWISFNPELETDYTYKEFVLNSSPDTEVCFINWRDNPWFPETLREEMEKLKARDYDAYLWVWEGQCRRILEGAVYGKELKLAQTEGRITKVPYLRQYPVDVFMDLGRADATSLWFRQHAGFELHYINYFEDRHQHIDYYLIHMQSLGYTYGTIWLPHDAKAKTLGTKMSVEEQIRAKGYRVRIVPKLSLADGILAARTIFPNCYFDEKHCGDGLKCLFHYSYEKSDRNGHFSETPSHDEYSHGADSFRYSGIAGSSPQPQGISEVTMAAIRSFTRPRKLGGGDGSTGWMR